MHAACHLQGVQAVVFDFDGVVADSMPQHAEAYRRVLSPYGIGVEAHRVFALEGARSESIIRQLLADAGRMVEHDEIQRLADKKQRVFQELGDPAIYPDAPALIAAVQRMAPTALVTGTRRDNLERLVPDLLRGFKAVMAAGDYQKDKPDPEPYARAAAALGREPAQCIAVENAPRGVQSARRAGYATVYAITTTMDADALAEADHVVADHAELRTSLLSRLQAA